jgi:hypothetical protein
MKKESKWLIKNKWFVLIILLFVVLFYWFQIRPATIKKDCANYSSEVVKKYEEGASMEEWENRYKLPYEACLHKRGL